MAQPYDYIWLLECVSLAPPWFGESRATLRPRLMGALKAEQTWQPILLSYEGETCQLKGQEPNYKVFPDS